VKLRGVHSLAPATSASYNRPWVCLSCYTNRSLGALSEKPKILCLCGDDYDVAEFFGRLDGSFEVVRANSPAQAVAYLESDAFSGVHIAPDRFSEAFKVTESPRAGQILDCTPDGMALVDAENTIVWANRRLLEWMKIDDAVGMNFYAALNSPEIMGPDFCPFHTAMATGKSSCSTLRAEDNRCFQVHAAPIVRAAGVQQNLVVTVRDVTEEVMQQQKLHAIHNAGAELADLTTEEVFNMEVEERIELLKSNILHYTKDLLQFDVVEIRLLDQKTGQLIPQLSVGIDEGAASRPLYAKTQNNGVTGFVAATGKSYLCEDTTADPLYLEGFRGARSSLTVPLILHDEVIGTFNVESPEPRAFSESDLQFLEIFSRDFAAAINTLELLVAQQANTAQASAEAIHSAVALPVDEILNDAVNIMEHYIGHQPDVVERLQRVLRNARDIKQVIQKVGQKMTPSQAVPPSLKRKERPKMRDRRVLVVDADEAVRGAAHALLERYGCIVETAHRGEEAIMMVRSMSTDVPYDVIIADVRLPDLNGFELFEKLKETVTRVPLVLMTGFGYDPGHSIVKARQAGLSAQSVLYKPFRLDQLLSTVESTLDA